MDDKRLTAYLNPLHFQVSGLFPIPVGEVQWVSDSKPNIQKPSVPAEGFCLYSFRFTPSLAS
ncbi:hypothetical protein [Paraburkholderia sp.]|jgi:hypothetical protein|uniref:hypothetical protein n=1 Tax=Paraburkholderia sp. TaxID=1926495 RepID=UPI002F42E6F1